MQDAFSQDMFNLGGINNSRCNGHIPVSTPGNVSKRDRKGCKKGKIEAIMKNNMVSSKSRVRLQTSPVIKKVKPLLTSTNQLKSGVVIKNEIVDSDDPYTFTDSEPLTIYPGTANLTLSRKLVPLVNNKCKRNVNMVCLERDPDISKVNKLVSERLNPSAELSSKPLLPKSNKCMQPLEGSSKTMNKLQADIARNKVIGKRKKIVNSVGLIGRNWEESKIKTEPSSSKDDASIFGQVTIPPKRRLRDTTWQREKKSRHEALQRVQLHRQHLLDIKQDLYPLGIEVSDSESDDDIHGGAYQRHWFTGCGVWGGGAGRDSLLSQANNDLRRRVCQVWRGVDQSCDPPVELVSSIIEAARRHPNSTARLLHPQLKQSSKLSRAKTHMLVPQKCSLDCERPALPCTRHCALHIMYNVDQQLYQHCTAKFPDNTQCCTPVFDITHQQPLCHKHGSIFDNVMKSHLAGRSKKCVKKKSKPPALSRATKRGKKKKRCRSSFDYNDTDLSEVEIKTEPLMLEECGINNMDDMMLRSSHEEVYLTDAVPTSQVEIQVQMEDTVEVVSDEVLAIASLDPTDLATQASRLLEEHDITSMLNQIPPDAFSDLFLAEDKNGVFAPTIEQTEGLERALEAVDKEVRSLERMTSSLPLMPIDSISLLDDVGGYVTYPNGFTPIAQAVQNHPELRHS